MLKVIFRPVYLLLWVLPFSVLAAENPEKPNILLLLADDFGYSDSAIYRDIYQTEAVLVMPALETLASAGTRYTRFYTESTCSASRAALLTGQYAARNGFAPVARGISADVITLPEYLRMQGYRTHHVGKWHVGEINKEAFPAQQGFDSSFGFLSQWLLQGPDSLGEKKLKPPTYNNPWLEDERGNYRQYQGHLEDILADQTVKLIKSGNQAKQPWFIYHAFLAPHTPLEPAQRFAKRFKRTPQGKYQAMLAQMDDSLQKIFSALRESGQWDNTIIIFASDNGAPGKHGSSNAPFSGSKSEYEEGGIRVPLVIKWQHSQQVDTRSDVTSIMDIYPSLAAVVEGQPPKNLLLDGVASLQPQGATSRKHPLYFSSLGSFSVLAANGKWRLMKQWDKGEFVASRLFNYDKQGLPLESGSAFTESIFGKHNRLRDNMLEDFLQWRSSVSEAPVHFVPTNSRGAGKVSGSEFLRSPINPAFALAFSFRAVAAEGGQTLLYQKDILQVFVRHDTLYAEIHGLRVKAAGLAAGQCHSVILSGEFYDRYSGLQQEIHTSRLHLIVDGKERDVASGTINSFEKLHITAPTWVGSKGDGKGVFPGTISPPRFFSTQLLPDDTVLFYGFEGVTEAVCP